MFRSLLPEPEPRQWLDLKSTKARWDSYRNGLASKYEFDDAQIEQANRVLESHLRAVQKYLRDYKDDIRQYLNGQDFLENAQLDPMVKSLPSLDDHISRNKTELSQLSKDLIPAIKDFGHSLELQLLALRTDKQKQQGGYPIHAAGGLWSIQTIDRVIPYFTLIVGVLLLLGLFTRTASSAGAIFLFMVMATQPPWIADTTPIHNQLVEAWGLLVLAGTAAGRFAGLDFFLLRCCGPIHERKVK